MSIALGDIHEHNQIDKLKITGDCSMCKKKIEGQEGYKCKNCPLSLCMECVNKIITESKRESLHIHDLLLKYKKGWVCDICKIQYKNKASFSCTNCDYDLCEKCYLGKGPNQKEQPHLYQQKISKTMSIA